MRTVEIRFRAGAQAYVDATPAGTVSKRLWPAAGAKRL